MIEQGSGFFADLNRAFETQSGVLSEVVVNLEHLTRSHHQNLHTLKEFVRSLERIYHISTHVQNAGREQRTGQGEIMKTGIWNSMRLTFLRGLRSLGKTSIESMSPLSDCTGFQKTFRRNEVKANE